jgi:hypothetical protein
MMEGLSPDTGRSHLDTSVRTARCRLEYAYCLFKKY